MKKFVSFMFLIICATCILFISSCSKSEDHTNYFNFRLIDDSTYVVNDNSLNYLEKDTYMVVSLNKERSLPETLIIPSEYNGKKVTAVGNNLLDGANIKTLILPHTIKLVGTNLCGSGCNNCPTLEKVVCLGYSPFFLGSFAFDESQLRGACKIYVPDETIEYYKSFNEGAIDLAEYKDLIMSLSELDENTKKYIANNIDTITYEEAKEQDVSLKYYIDENASKGFEYERNADGTYSITGMGSCTDKNIIIPKFYRGLDVTIIGKSAFIDCSNIESITIYDNITKIEGWAFQRCTSLKNIYIEDMVSWCNISMGYDSNPMCNGANLYLNNTLVEDLVIPDGTERISDYVFDGCTSIKKVVLPNSITSIGNDSFKHCYKLEYVLISEGTTTIGERAFQSCESLNTIIIPSSLKEIKHWAFGGCDSLAKIFYAANSNAWENVTIDDVSKWTFRDNGVVYTYNYQYK